MKEALFLKLSSLLNTHLTPQAVMEQQELTHEECTHLIDLFNTRHAIEATKDTTSDRVRKLMLARGRELAPVTLIFKPVIFKGRFVEEEELDTELASAEPNFQNINKYKTVFAEGAVKKQGDIVKVCTSIMAEVKYFRTRKHKTLCFRWLKVNKPKLLPKYKKEAICGKAKLNQFVRDLKKKHCGDTIKGFRIFTKKNYRPLERVIVRSTFTGKISAIPVTN